MIAALRNSHTLATARAGRRLAGLGKAISDGYLVVYYPHLLLHPEFRGKGVGRCLMQKLRGVYSGFHQQMLTADEGTVDLYRTQGFERAGSTEPMWIYAGGDHQTL